MERLKSYFSILDSRLLHHIKGKPAAFIRLFQEQEYLNEEAFIQRFCGKKYTLENYYELKSRTIGILQVLAIASAPRGKSLVKKKYEICQKKFLIGRKFLNKGEKTARKEGLMLIKQAYKIALEYEFAPLIGELCSLLYHHHVYYSPNANKAAFYADQAERFLVDYLAEKRAEHRFYDCIEQLNGKMAVSVLQENLIIVNQNKGKSVKYLTYRAMIEVLYQSRIADYNGIIRCCQKVLIILRKRKGVYSSHHQFFLLQLGFAQMATAQYDEADRSFVESQSLAETNSINDYVLRLYRTINALHAGNYQIAYDLYRQNRKCKFENVRQQFTIIEAYMCFLAHNGHLILDRTFRIGKYLNETLKAQADKQGDNIAILIAELLVYLTRDRGKFIDRVEAINNYSYRNLKSAYILRAKNFIKILCTLPRANFNPISLQRKAQKSIQYLKDHPLAMGDTVDIEIIPFEHLLDMIMVHLKQKRA